MKRIAWLLAVVMMIVMIAPSFAAPLFGDVPEQHWGRDAVADLAAKGILEGYPDGTFKGDRAATRWEMAVVVQRLLAKMEQEHATFATKADLEALRSLVNSLRDELDALGARVKNLEENVAQLDTRVTELERITFFGDVTTRFVAQGFANSGENFTNSPAWAPFVGTAAGPNAGARGHGVNDFFNGVPLTNGTGHTTRATFGVKVKVNKDIDVKAKFAAFVSTGDVIVDGFWGVHAPYLSNPFTGNSAITGALGTGAQSIGNSPWTRLTLDSFMLNHKPSGLKLIVGSYDKTNFDSLVIYGEPNPAAFANGLYEKSDAVFNRLINPLMSRETLPFYGVCVNGKTRFITDMKYEIAYSKLANGDAYFPTMFGFNLDWKWAEDRAAFKINFARLSDSAPNGAVLMPSGIAMPFGAGMWTNPPGQTGVVPIAAAGTFGPQGETLIGASLKYKFEPSNFRIKIGFGSSTYKPRIDGDYDKSGGAFTVGLGYTIPSGALDLKLDYISVDPFYDPFMMTYPGTVGGLTWQRWPLFSFYNGYYQLHDSDAFPNNRQGIRAAVEYRFANENGKINLDYGSMTQVKSSVTMANGGDYDRPGFIEPVFTVLNAANEDVKGDITNWGVGVDYKFSPSALRAILRYDNFDYERKTNNKVAADNIDLNYNAIKIGLSYPFSDKFTLRGGYDIATMKGRYLCNANVAENIDVSQSSPYLGFDYEVGKNTCWSMDIRTYSTSDNVDTATYPTSPESFTGMQFMTQLKITF